MKAKVWMMLKKWLADGCKPVAAWRPWKLSVLALACYFSLGMGGTGQMVDIPEPVNNFAVTLTDGSGLSIRLEKFSIAGKTFFSGKFGLAEASVYFQKVDTVMIESREENVIATLNLTEGTTMVLEMPGDTVCYGESKVALVRIKLADIKTITVHGQIKSDP